MKEIKQIKGYEHVKEGYFVTKEGKIYTCRNNAGAITDKFKERKQSVKTGGYLNVGLQVEGSKTKWFRVHRIVASAFIPNSDLNKEYVNHKDENRQNNNVENLEWVTPKGNNLHSLSKKVYAYNLNGDLLKIYKYAYETGEDGYNQGHVCSCARNEIKYHKNVIFSYVPLSKDDIVQRLAKPYYLNGRRK